MNKVHVDDLMREIEATAAQAGAEPRFPQLELEQLLPTLREQHLVQPRPPLIGHTRYERLWVRINKLVRRFAAHAVEPAVAQQNEFNATLQTTLEDLITANARLRAAVIARRAAQNSSTTIEQPDA